MATELVKSVMDACHIDRTTRSWASLCQRR